MALIAHTNRFRQTFLLRNFLHLVEVNMFEKIALAQMVANALRGDVLACQGSPRMELFETGK